jgi:hypothetical protein
MGLLNDIKKLFGRGKRDFSDDESDEEMRQFFEEQHPELIPQVEQLFQQVIQRNLGLDQQPRTQRYRKPLKPGEISIEVVPNAARTPQETRKMKQQAYLWTIIWNWIRIKDENKSKAYLKRYPELLTDESVNWLAGLLSMARDDNDAELADMLQDRLTRLRRARTEGIDGAFS